MNETELYERISSLATRVGELNRKVDFILTELKLEYHEPDSAEFNEIQNLLRANREIDAIKLYREKYRVSLELAKQEVEKIEMGG